MLRRTGFKRKVYEPPPAAPARPLERPPVYTGTTLGPAPKEVAARPGKGAPTSDERAWMDAIVAYGCVACRLDGHASRQTAVHHILRGGQRIGHLYTLPLCDPGHHQGGDSIGLVSRHPWKARFEERYGSELQLLEALRMELGFPDGVRARASA